VTRSPRLSIARASETLRLCEMPPEEIRAVLTADDPEIVHRFLELHRERLEEDVAERTRTLASLEQLLTEKNPA
jgi:CRP-like cAMP-binding protein